MKLTFILENVATLPQQTTTMACNNTIAAAVSQDMGIAGLTKQVADLYLFRVKEVKNITTERVQHWCEILS